MKTRAQLTTMALALIGVLGGGAVGTGWAQTGRPSERQGDKNTMRNLGLGLGAAALDSAKNGRVGDALALGAGAAYAGKKYEDARKAQRDDDRWDRGDRLRERNCDPDDYLRERYVSPSRWERERWERERRERELRERQERIERERREREREERLRWERLRREREERCRDHRR